MLLSLILSSVFIFVHATDPQTVLYVYASPIQSETTGFATLSSIHDGWKPYAKGYPTEITPAGDYNGLVTNRDGTDGILFGAFQFWEDVYVGSLLHFNPNTLEVEAIGKGISGTDISSAAYIYGSDENGNPIEYTVILGSFWSFQQKPATSTVNTGVCFDKGKSCNSLGAGLALYEYYGSLLVIDQMIYALYLASDKTCRIDSYDFQNGNFTGAWQNIYVGSPSFGLCRQSIVRITDSDGSSILVLLANETTNENTGMVMFKPNQGWITYGPFPFPLKKNYHAYSISHILFLVQNNTFFRWNGVNWTTIWTSSECSNTILIPISEYTFISPCVDSFAVVQLSLESSVNVSYSSYPAEFSCEWDYQTCTYDPVSQVLIAICLGTGNITYLDSYYIGDKPTLLVHQSVGALATLAQEVTSFCVFGNGKMFISGYFDHIGDTAVEGSAVWDGMAWNRLDPYLGLSKDYSNCFCSAEYNGNSSMIAVGCSVAASRRNNYTSVLLVSQESLEESSPTVQSDYYPFTVIFPNQTQPITALTLQDSIIYIAWYDSVGNTTITKWNESEEVLFSTLGSVYGLVPYGNLFYLSGYFDLDEEGNGITIQLYDIASKQFLPVENVKNSADPWSSLGMLFQDIQDNSTLYVGGAFDQAGNLPYAHNIALLNTSNGVFVDNLDGGIPGQCIWATSIDLVLFMVYQISGCSKVPQCLSLTSYVRSEEQWSNTLRSGVYQLAQGYEYATKHQEKSASIWWVYLLVGFTSCGLLILACFMLFHAVKIYRRRKLHILHMDDLSHCDYREMLSDLSDVDFQHEDVILKTVLGRGSFGTVWSCVLPHRGGASYAVKQVLISVGEPDKIAAVEQEVQILQRLRHKNIVHFAGYKKEVTKSSVEFFLFMELFEKPCSLRGVIEKRAKKSSVSGSAFFTFTEVRNFLKQILCGIQYLHQNGIAHRDLKCANILVRVHNTTITSLLIADFGLAKTFFADSQTKVLASTIAGTPAFMAPEVLKGEKYDPFKADVWSFGIVIFEIITFLEPKEPGKRPKMRKESHFPYNQELFKPIVRIFKECTAKDPTMRPDVDSLVDTIEYLE